MTDSIGDIVQKLIEKEGYKDEDGNPILLETLCKQSPEWAANIIRHWKSQVELNDECWKQEKETACEKFDHETWADYYKRLTDGLRSSKSHIPTAMFWLIETAAQEIENLAKLRRVDAGYVEHILSGEFDEDFDED